MVGRPVFVVKGQLDSDKMGCSALSVAHSPLAVFHRLHTRLGILAYAGRCEAATYLKMDHVLAVTAEYQRVV